MPRYFLQISNELAVNIFLHRLVSNQFTQPCPVLEFKWIGLKTTVNFCSDKNGTRRDSQGKPKDSCLGKIAIGKNDNTLSRKAW